MGRMFAMGVSASNASTDLADRARAHASAREGMIEAQIKDHMERTGMDYGQASQLVRTTIEGARRRLKLAGGEQTPNFNDHGVAAPVMVHGEIYQTEGVDYHKGGDRTLHVARPIGGGRFARRTIELKVDGGERTRVVASARGG